MHAAVRRAGPGLRTVAGEPGIERDGVADEERRQIKVTWDELAGWLPALAEVREDVSGFVPSDAWEFCGTALWTGGWTTNFKDGSVQTVVSPIERAKTSVASKTGMSTRWKA